MKEAEVYTIKELQSTKSQDCWDWEPLDLLNSLQRDIKNGTLNPRGMTVAFLNKEGEHETVIYRTCKLKCREQIFMLEAVKHIFLNIFTGKD